MYFVNFIKRLGYDPLGMENGAISYGQISASSQYNEGLSAVYGRLNLKASSGNGGGWTPKTNGEDEWLQVELGKLPIKVTRLATQESDYYEDWVTTYKLQYSDDGVNFLYYREKGQTTDKVREA